MVLVALLFWLAQRNLSQQPSSVLVSLAQTAVPVLAVLCTLAAFCCRPWLMAPARKLPEAKPAPAPEEASAQQHAPGGVEEKEKEGSEVDVVASAASGHMQEQSVQLRALSKVCAAATSFGMSTHARLRCAIWHLQFFWLWHAHCVACHSLACMIPHKRLLSNTRTSLGD